MEHFLRLLTKTSVFDSLSWSFTALCYILNENVYTSENRYIGVYTPTFVWFICSDSSKDGVYHEFQKIAVNCCNIIELSI